MELHTIGIDLGKTTFHLAGWTHAEKWWCGSDFPHQAIALYREPEDGTDRHRSLRGSHFLG